MKVAIYPGTFNPWHEGHDEVLEKAMLMFDKIIIAVGQNPTKELNTAQVEKVRDDAMTARDPEKDYARIRVVAFSGLFADFVNSVKEKENVVAVVRGMRNFVDFEAEKAQQYNNEDLGLDVPTIYLISSRELTHVTSSSIRSINRAKGGRRG